MKRLSICFLLFFLLITVKSTIPNPENSEDLECLERARLVAINCPNKNCPPITCKPIPPPCGTTTCGPKPAITVSTASIIASTAATSAATSAASTAITTAITSAATTATTTAALITDTTVATSAITSEVTTAATTAASTAATTAATSAATTAATTATSLVTTSTSAASTSSATSIASLVTATSATLTTFAATTSIITLPPPTTLVPTIPCISLNSSYQFAILGASTVTNTNPTVISGDLGLYPGTSVTGFPPGIVLGFQHITDAVAQTAQNDLTSAYTSLVNLPCDTDLTGQDLGGLTLNTGVYCFDTSAQLTGTLTLDLQGNPDAVFVFQIGSTLTTASNSVVSVINGGNGCNIYWQVGSSATLGTMTTFVGNILALTSITANSQTSVRGRLLAGNGAVTLDNNGVSNTLCLTCLSPAQIVSIRKSKTNMLLKEESGTDMNTINHIFPIILFTLLFV